MKKIIPAILAVAVIAGTFSASFNSSEAAQQGAMQTIQSTNMQEMDTLTSADYSSLYFRESANK